MKRERCMRIQYTLSHMTELFAGVPSYCRFSSLGARVCVSFLRLLVYFILFFISFLILICVALFSSLQQTSHLDSEPQHAVTCERRRQRHILDRFDLASRLVPACSR